MNQYWILLKDTPISDSDGHYSFDENGCPKNTGGGWKCVVKNKKEPVIYYKAYPAPDTGGGGGASG